MSSLLSLLTGLCLALTISACSDDGGAAPDAASADMLLSGPPATTMTAASTSNVVGASICMTPQAAGGFDFSLQSNVATSCFGGAAYLTFALDGGDYSVTAGEELTDDSGGRKAVTIGSTSQGSVTQNAAGADQVTGLAEGADITIGTASHSRVTFSFSGAAVTVSAFE